MDGGLVWRALWRSGSFSSPRAALWSGATVGLEAAARALGHYDVTRGRSPYVWRAVLGRIGLVNLDSAPGPTESALSNLRIFLGHAGWAPGQLDGELERPPDELVHGRVLASPGDQRGPVHRARPSGGGHRTLPYYGVARR